MEARTQSWPPVDDGTVSVVAATLQDAYRRVKKEYGDEAVIVESRSVSRRQATGLGHVRGVEVMVQTDSPAPVRRPAPATASAAADLAREVERIESLVASIEAEHARLRTAGAETASHPLADALTTAGASADAIEHIGTRFTSETGRGAGDRAAMLAWLADNVPASNSEWDGFYGCHAFLGRSGAARTELILAAARQLQARGRRTLVLSIMPAHRGEVRRLQAAAAAGSFDAAVIQKPESITAAAGHLADYDAVLLDLPDLDSATMAGGQTLHAWLAANEGFHRHLVLPLDGDARDLGDLAPRAREWNCDWLALSHTDRSRRWGKVLDLQRSFGLPLSLLAAEDPEGAPRIARSEEVLDRMLGAGPMPDFVAADPLSGGV